MVLTIILVCAALLIVLSALSIALHRGPLGRIVVYGGALIVSLAALAAALAHLLGQAPVEALTLPIGLPWLGAHFRLDALSAFFLVVVGLGGAAASLYALGYGKHERGAAARAAVLSAVPRRDSSSHRLSAVGPFRSSGISCRQKR